MNKLLLLLCLAFPLLSFGQDHKQKFVSTDLNNFWAAYDKIVSTTDSIEQHRLLNDLYISKGTPGLKSLMEVRNYSSNEFITAIKSYPNFWKSLRPYTTNVEALYPSIEADIKKLKQVYPALKPATIYFTVGAFRSNGTIQNDRVLIGSELTLAGKEIVIDELPAWRQPFYNEYNPRENIALLCTHEYIHTQQNRFVENLLSMCLYEGIAEFVSCKATGKQSNSPAIAFGKANERKVISKYVTDLFTMSNNYHWLWGENTNELQVRDLGYYVGYEIAERYYNLAPNKQKAVKELIELDYHNEKEVERIVDITKLLPSTLNDLYAAYEKDRPTVASISGIENGSDKVKPGVTKITIRFSEPLNGYNTGVDFGPLGQQHFPKIDPKRTWSAENREWTIEAHLEPNQHYQVLISNNFRKANGVRLKPFLIEFKTGGF